MPKSIKYKDAVHVGCLVLPDGTVRWFEVGKTSEKQISLFYDKWRDGFSEDKRKEYIAFGVNAGIVEIYMPPDVYKKLPKELVIVGDKEDA